MNRQVTLSVKALVIGGLCAIVLFGLALELVNLHRSLDNAKLVLQVQQNTANIQTIDRVLTQAMKDIEGMKEK